MQSYKTERTEYTLKEYEARYLLEILRNYDFAYNALYMSKLVGTCYYNLEAHVSPSYKYRYGWNSRKHQRMRVRGRWMLGLRNRDRPTLIFN